VSAAQVIGLGCRLNIAESERIGELLAGRRDRVVVNSCAVTGEAVRHTRRAIRRARREHPGARLIVTGCAAETERAALEAMPEVDEVLANARKLLPASYGSQAAAPSLASARTRAFVPVQNGCDHACTFCIIPRGRGPSRSFPVPTVLAEIAAHLERGAREIVLTGVDVTAWGHDLEGEARLGDLVAAILSHFPALPRLRLSSLDGAEIDPLLFELLASEPRIMPHLHLSLQHGADLILKRMKRRHSRGQAVALVEALKRRRPAIAIGADLIAGFPTECESDHAQNLSLVDAIDIVHGHVFPFSPRPGTPAARMPQVPAAAIRERAGELRARIAARRARWLGALVGTPLRVLAEKGGQGYAENYARVSALDAAPGTIATIVPRRVEDELLT
jgi:threonylcarbamoyladenosine tRNA methylthiotransferase MtaB